MCRLLLNCRSGSEAVMSGCVRRLAACALGPMAAANAAVNKTQIVRKWRRRLMALFFLIRSRGSTSRGMPEESAKLNGIANTAGRQGVHGEISRAAPPRFGVYQTGVFRRFTAADDSPQERKIANQTPDETFWRFVGAVADLNRGAYRRHNSTPSFILGAMRTSEV